MSEIPTIPSKELLAFKRYESSTLSQADNQDALVNHACLLCDYVRLELSGERLVVENDYWAAVVPWWATWPFEILCEHR